MEASPHLNPKRGPFSGSRLLQAQPDGVLCRLALRGNPGAFEALYTRHHGALYGFLFHLLGRGASAEDAEDIAQESFSTAFSKLADRRDDGSFKSWLFTIARNRAVDHMRAGRPPTADVTELPLAAAGGPERQAESKAEMAWLMTALADLPERQREALVMREMGGLSYDEIAVGMQTTVPGVKQLINRARGTLNEAADVSELRPRRLRKELAALVPVLPIATVSAGVAAFGVATTGAGVAASAGGISAATKVAAVALAVAAIGGGAAGLTSSTGARDDVRASTGQSAAGDATDNLSGDDDGSGGEGRDGSGSDGRSGGDDSEDRSGSRREDGSRDDRGRDRSDDSGDDSGDSRRRGSSDDSTRGEDDVAGSEDDHSGTGSGSGSGDDSPEAPEAPEVDEPDEPEPDEPDEPDEDRSGSGSGGESQSSGSGSSPELPED